MSASQEDYLIMMDAKLQNEMQKVGLNPQALQLLRNILLKDLTTAMFKKIDDDFEDVLETLIDTKYEMNATANKSILDKTLPPTPSFCRRDIEKRLVTLEKFRDDTEPDMSVIKKDMGCLKTELNGIQSVCKSLADQGDAQEQYGRLEILVFGGIKYILGTRGKEDPTSVIINFLRTCMGIFITNRDISICHRQYNPSEKSKMGKDYVPAIYCKFLNRSLAKLILKKRYMLKKYPQYTVEENLTLPRRLLLERVQNELPRFSHWISNGNIFIKEHSQSRPIKINTTARLEEFLESRIIGKSDIPPKKNQERKKNSLKQTPSKKQKSHRSGNEFPSSCVYAKATQEDPVDIPRQRMNSTAVSGDGLPLEPDDVFSPIGDDSRPNLGATSNTISKSRNPMLNIPPHSPASQYPQLSDAPPQPSLPPDKRTHKLLTRPVFPPPSKPHVSRKQFDETDLSYAHVACSYTPYERNPKSISRNSLLSPNTLKHYHQTIMSSYYSNGNRINRRPFSS